MKLILCFACFTILFTTAGCVVPVRERTYVRHHDYPRHHHHYHHRWEHKGFHPPPYGYYERQPMSGSQGGDTFAPAS